GFVWFNLLFLTMFFYGKMPRRIFEYDNSMDYAYGGLQLGALNLVATIGAFLFGAGVILMIVNFVASLWTGERAGPDPWGGDSLEWTMSSPPPPENFTAVPELAAREAVAPPVTMPGGGEE